MTIHKPHGNTFSQDVFVYLGGRVTLGTTFGALSREKSFDNLWLYPFDFDRYEKIGQGTYVEQRAHVLE